MLHELGVALLLGVSRKSFIGRLSRRSRRRSGWPARWPRASPGSIGACRSCASTTSPRPARRSPSGRPWPYLNASKGTYHRHHDSQALRHRRRSRHRQSGADHGTHRPRAGARRRRPVPPRRSPPSRRHRQGYAALRLYAGAGADGRLHLHGHGCGPAGAAADAGGGHADPLAARRSRRHHLGLPQSLSRTTASSCSGPTATSSPTRSRSPSRRRCRPGARTLAGAARRSAAPCASTMPAGAISNSSRTASPRA